MMTTVQQADIMALLTDFKYLRLSHIIKYLEAKHNSKSEHISIMLKQLSVMGKVKATDGFVMLPGRKINPCILKAFDVMMDLTDGCVDLVCPGVHPFTLMFSVEAELSDVQDKNSDEQHLFKHYNNFGIIDLEPYCENSICSRINVNDRELTVIFILSEKEQHKSITIDGSYYCAIQDVNGKYKFFKAANEPRK